MRTLFLVIHLRKFDDTNMTNALFLSPLGLEVFSNVNISMKYGPSVTITYQNNVNTRLDVRKGYEIDSSYILPLRYVSKDVFIAGQMAYFCFLNALNPAAWL